MIDFVTLLLRPAIALGIIVFLFWLWNKHGQKVEAWVKRKFPARGDASTHRSVTVRESRRLSRKASIMVVDFEGERLLLGISDGVLSKLHSVNVWEAEMLHKADAAESDEAAEDNTDIVAPAAPKPKPAERIAFGDALKSAAFNSLSPFIPQRNKLK